MTVSASQWEVLAQHDVYPLPLATEVNWANDGWEVIILALTDATTGHSGVVLWRHREPYRTSGSRDAKEAREVTGRAVEAFARRLADVLGVGLST